MSDHSGIRTITLAILLLVFPTVALAQSVVGVLGIATEIAPIERQLKECSAGSALDHSGRGEINSRNIAASSSKGL